MPGWQQRSPTNPLTPTTGPLGHGCMMTAMKAASVSNTHIKSPEPYKDYFGHSSTECVILIGYYAVCWVLMLYNVGVAYL